MALLMAETTLFAQTRDGTQRVELPQATIESYTFRLNQPGALTATIAPRKLPDGNGDYTIPISDVLEPGVHELGVRRGGSVVWLGPTQALDETDGPDGPQIQVAAEGLAAYLWTGKISTHMAGSTGGQFHDTDQATIVHAMLAHLTSKASNWVNLDITGVDTPTGVLRTRTEYNVYRSLTIGDEIVKLAEVEDGFDYDIDPASRLFRLHYPSQGRRRDNVTFNPGNIIGFERSVDSTGQASSVLGFGDGLAEGTYRRRHTDSAAIAKYGATEANWVGSNITHIPTLDARTKAHLQQVKDPTETISVSVRFGPNLPFGSFGIGDEIRIDWPESVYSPVSTYRRVVGIDIHPHPDESATVHLNDLGVG